MPSSAPAHRTNRSIGSVIATALCFLFWAGVAQADYTVSNTDDDGTGSLRQAIVDANANSGADVVDATAVTGTINLASALPDLSDDVEVHGPGADQLTVRRDTGGDYRIFTVPAGVVAEISGLTIANGAADSGGGIANEGTLTLNASTVSGNTAVDEAGGIYNLGTATIDGTTMEGNSTTTDDGGGISNYHTMTITNTTVTGNTAPGERGGGIVNNGDDVLTITSSTIARNTAADGANLFQGSRGDPLPVLLTSTILADPLGADDCATGGGGEIDSQGYNLADDGSCDLDATGDQPGADAQLAPLADNGGPTETLMPAPASPAVDQGVSDALTEDQRGLTRPHDFAEVPDAAGGDAADIGAVELQADEFDFDAPETTITKHPKRKLRTDDRRVRVRFRFEGTDDFSAADALTFECKLDRKPVRPCTSPFKKRVKPGKHRFRVWATDEVGNADQTPARFRFKVKSVG